MNDRLFLGMVPEEVAADGEGDSPRNAIVEVIGPKKQD
jgi:hypothetical protein